MNHPLDGVPPPPSRGTPTGGAEAAVALGLRRRRQAAGLAGVASVTVLGVVSALVLQGSSGNRADGLTQADDPRPSAVAVGTVSPTPRVVVTPKAATPTVTVTPAGTTGTTHSPTPDAVTTTAPPPDHTPLVIGNVGTYSGVLGVTGVPYRDALKAYVKHANASGGIDGHPVTLLVYDDQGDPSTHRSALESLKQRHISALVGADGDEQTDADVLKGTGIPVLGAGLYASRALTGYVDYLPAGTAWQAEVFGYLVETKRQGGQRVAVFSCVEVPDVCDGEKQLIEGGYARDAGLTVDDAASATVSITTPSYTGECLRARQDEVDSLLLVVDEGSAARIIDSCNKVDYHPRYVLSPIAVGPGVTPPDGTVAVQPGVPWVVTGEVAAERARLLKAAGVPLTAASADGWAAALLLQAVVEHADGISPRALRSAAGSLRDETLGGLAPSLAGGAFRAAPPVRCWAPLLRKGGVWTAPLGTGFRCGSKPA